MSLCSLDDFRRREWTKQDRSWPRQSRPWVRVIGGENCKKGGARVSEMPFQTIFGARSIVNKVRCEGQCEWWKLYKYEKGGDVVTFVCPPYWNLFCCHLVILPKTSLFGTINFGRLSNMTTWSYIWFFGNVSWAGSPTSLPLLSLAMQWVWHIKI